MSNVLLVLPLATLIASVVAAVMTVWNAALALRAKDRLRRKLHDGVITGTNVQQMKRLSKIAAERPLNPDEVEIARRLIEVAAQSLPTKDRVYLENGLNQSSKSGERRYIKDLMAA